MVNFHVITLFPEIFDVLNRVGLIKKAVDKGVLSFSTVNPRDFTTDKHRTVDDTPFGGGEGMVMKIEPVLDAVMSVKSKAPDARVVFLSPQGKMFRQEDAVRFSKEKNIILVCGRYEGIDNRFAENFVDEEISVGDFILGGGEFAALSFIESVSRVVPGVVGNKDSILKDSFSDGLLKHPQYTRPAIFKGLRVPEVLLSGNHEKIARWRHLKKLENTYKKRKDLLDSYFFKHREEVVGKIYVALLHHPVYNKNKEVVTTAITNTDIHDIARVSRTYGIKKFYIATPISEQQKLINDIISHWTEGYGAKHNPRRSEAIKVISVKKSIEEIVSDVKKETGLDPITVTTSARQWDNSVDFTFLKYKLLSEKNPMILIFGTGWGLTFELINSMDYILKPIHGIGSYNHLSVRSAVSIIIDRLLGGSYE